VSKLNSTTQSIVVKSTSHEGGDVFKASPYQELCDRVLTSFYGENKFYESGATEISKLNKLIKKVAKSDPIFVAKLAVLAREEFKLRTISQVLISELSTIYRGDDKIKHAIARVIQRPDDMTEILSYIIAKAKTEQLPNGRTKNINKKIPNSIKKGIAIAVQKFDAYQLSKYNSSKKTMKLKDVFNLVHPKPKDLEQAANWKALLNGTLEKADTWERKISASGKTEDSETAKSEAWEELIMNNKLGYMATLRNINNFLSANISKEAHAKVCSYLSNEKAVYNSKQMPFRFYSAYKIITENSRSHDPFVIKQYLAALNTAIRYSVKNLTKIDGRTMVVVDTSGSMSSAVSQHSTMTCAEIGCLMGSIVNEMCDDAIIAAFATDFKIVDLSGDNLLDQAHKIMGTQTGYGTNVHLIFDWLLENNINVNNIIILSDMQVVSGVQKAIRNYKKKINPELVIYEWNLRSYGDTLTDASNPNHVKLTGWHDNMIKFVAEYKTMRKGILDMVNSVNL